MRSRFSGFIALVISLSLSAVFIYFTFIEIFGKAGIAAGNIPVHAYYAISLPMAIVAIGICLTGLWVGWTILTIKVAPPMPEIVEKKDYAKVKAFILCTITLFIIALFLYGLYLRSYWALAIPAAAVTLVVLGMVFWVGIAIISARSTLSENKKQ